MRKYVLLMICSFALLISSCSKSISKPVYVEQDIPLDIPRDVTARKPIQMWIDAHANLSLFSVKANITSYLEKMKETGFNEVYLDVKPGLGYAMYDSDILPQLKRWGNISITRDWDYLGFWLEEAERLEMSVIASISVMGYGSASTREGLIFDSNQWDGKTQVGMLDASKPTVLTDIRNDLEPDAVMLDPSIPEVQEFVVSIIAEIATKYPKLKGIALDYCRWWSGNYGFGTKSLAAFQAYSGKKLTSNNDIITANGGIGPLYKDWIEFRSMAVTNLITSINRKVKGINPKMELHLWASADWASRYSVGQNWASKNFKPAESSIYTSTYNKTGFADQIDVFSLGAYTERIFISENPGSVWSVENFVTSYNNFIQGDCKVFGSFASYAYGSNATKISDAVYLCLQNTDGVMAFEISHVINNQQWDAIKAGIDRVYK